MRAPRRHARILVAREGLAPAVVLDGVAAVAEALALGVHVAVEVAQTLRAALLVRCARGSGEVPDADDSVSPVRLWRARKQARDAPAGPAPMIRRSVVRGWPGEVMGGGTGGVFVMGWEVRDDMVVSDGACVKWSEPFVQLVELLCNEAGPGLYIRLSQHSAMMLWMLSAWLWYVLE